MPECECNADKATGCAGLYLLNICKRTQACAKAATAICVQISFFHTWGSGLEMGQGIVIPQRSTSDLAWQVLPNQRPESNLCSETIAFSVPSMTLHRPPGKINISALLCHLLFSNWAMMQMIGRVRWGWGDVCENVTFENSQAWYKPEPTRLHSYVESL